MKSLSLSFLGVSFSSVLVLLVAPLAVGFAQESKQAEIKPAKPTVTPQSSAKPPTRADRLDLDTTVVTGNRELPKVLYIVPWKKAELGELPAQPFNTLLDEVLSPVDRDVFKREVKYFQTVTEQQAQTPGAAAKETPR